MASSETDFLRNFVFLNFDKAQWFVSVFDFEIHSKSNIIITTTTC